jgi:hypothetical protein
MRKETAREQRPGPGLTADAAGSHACASHLGGTMAGEHIIAEAVRKLNRLELHIKDTKKHAQFLGTVKGIDARDLKKVAHELQVAAMAMEEYLLRLTGEAEQAARRFPARPFKAKTFGQQAALNPGVASAVGFRNELRALSKRIPQELDELHKQLGLLAAQAQAGLNDQGRWGDLAIASPVTDLFGFVIGVLELIGKYAEKRRAERQANPALR